MTNRTQDRVIVVTGAAGGQGAAEVAALHREGATVVATDVQRFSGPESECIHARHTPATSRRP